MTTPEKRAQKNVYGAGDLTAAKRVDRKESKRARNSRKRLERAAKRGTRFENTKDLNA
jgi:hypothetical protein